MSKHNIGTWDKGLRFFALAIMALPVFSRQERDWLTWLLIGIFFYLLITALSGHCFIYDWFNLNTADTDN